MITQACHSGYFASTCWPEDYPSLHWLGIGVVVTRGLRWQEGCTSIMT